MTQKPLLASPTEPYADHVERAYKVFEALLPHFESAAARLVFGDRHHLKENRSLLVKFLRAMVALHDTGKLTLRWQEQIAKKAAEGDDKHKLPPHASVGACYLKLYLERESGLEEENTEAADAVKAAVFSVAIHHVDSAMVGRNIESPDVQAIRSGLIDGSDDRVVWDQRAIAEGHLDPALAEQVTADALREMARRLRRWSRGCGMLEAHRRRLLVAAFHHILKVCDLAAASTRSEEELYGITRDFVAFCKGLGVTL